MFAITRSLIRTQPLRMKSMQIMQECTAPAKTINVRVIPVSGLTKDETFDEKNLRLGRQLSPHLTIYKPQLTSILSISHRITGCIMAGGLWTLGIGSLLLPHDINHYITMLEGLNLSDGTLTGLKFLMVYSFAYHCINGIRHLFWDTGRFLKISEVYSTGYATLILSVVLGLGLAVL